MSTHRFELSEAERRIYRHYAGLALPRHTSYPVAPFWTKDYGPAELLIDLRHSARAMRPLSLYVHIPFCEQLCYYCACTKEIVPKSKRGGNDPGDLLLGGLEIEARHFAEAIGAGEVQQVHLGGGSPTFLRPDQLEKLFDTLRSNFSIAHDAEIAVEIDPRVTSLEHLQTLRGLGFNRVSLGVQDFSIAVQHAINRVQPFELVQRLVDWCRSLAFSSINFDLIYGLPFQTLESMAETLEKTILLSPDRIAFYRLAVIPEIFRWQNVFRHTDLPSGDLSLDLNLLAINCLLDAGYRFIGLDHFAKPDEALAQASEHGSLRRTFQGMTTGKELDIIGLGPSAISQLDNAYAQSRKESALWGQALKSGLATQCGLHLSDDDRLRRELIQQLYGHGTIDKQSLEDRFNVVFDEYFADELSRLAELIEQGIVIADPRRIRLTAPLGRLLVRVVAAVFDRYLPFDAFRNGLPEQQASKVG